MINRQALELLTTLLLCGFPRPILSCRYWEESTVSVGLLHAPMFSFTHTHENPALMTSVSVMKWWRQLIEPSLERCEATLFVVIHVLSLLPFCIPYVHVDDFLHKYGDNNIYRHRQEKKSWTEVSGLYSVNSKSYACRCSFEFCSNCVTSSINIHSL